MWCCKNWPEVVAATAVEKLPNNARRKQSRFDTWINDVNLMLNMFTVWVAFYMSLGLLWSAVAAPTADKPLRLTWSCQWTAKISDIMII